MEHIIYLLPIGNISNEIVLYLKSEIVEVFHYAVELLPPMKSDLAFAYNVKRNQYYSSAILKKIASGKQKGRRIISLCDVDLYVPNLNFVFGEADVVNGVCIISVCRLRQEYYGLREDKEIFLTRSAKEAIHELGHTFGFDHCRNPKCVMFFSNSLSDTDRKSAQFCSRCYKILESID